MRLHEVLLSWDLDDLMTLWKHSSWPVDLTMLRWAARVGQLVPLVVRHRANSPDFFKVQRGTKWVAWGEVQIYIYSVRFVFCYIFFVDVPKSCDLSCSCGCLGWGSRNTPMLSLLFAVMCRTSDKRSHKIDRLVCQRCWACWKQTRVVVAGCCRDKVSADLILATVISIDFADVFKNMKANPASIEWKQGRWNDASEARQ